MFQNRIAKQGARARAVPSSGTAVFTTCFSPVVFPRELASIVPYAVIGFAPAIRKIRPPRIMAIAKAAIRISQIFLFGISSLLVSLIKGVFSFI